RATQGNPWIIGEIDHFLKTGNIAPKTPINVKKLTILRHISQIHKFYGENMGVRLARKHIFWYAMHLNQHAGLTFWKKVNKVNEPNLQYNFYKKMSSTDLPACINVKLKRYFKQLNGEKANNVFKMVIGDVEPIVIRHVLELTKQNHSEASRILGINRGTLKKKIELY
ncbi:MAG: tRNA-dihydrouridine synthase, partial [Candidatus Thioglobus sp.]|nr:tRNA-dihydrouridine synthase [Candidatus Thioglobus sp.]